ncbi:MAG: DUF2750 domain-containing protein [Thalassotalea sp.]
MTALTEQQISEILQYPADKRLNYSFKSFKENKQIWILTDEHGSVMLNTEDEDCVPVWPLEEFALRWATGEWQGFKAEAISVNKWRSRWTQGLLEDDLAIVVFPSENEEGLVLYPDELDVELEKNN